MMREWVMTINNATSATPVSVPAGRRDVASTAENVTELTR